MSFVHLHVHTPFSFLDGAGKIEDLIAKAVEMGCPAIAMTDHNNLCGAVKFHQLATAAGIKPIIGTEITMQDGHHLTLLARNPLGYANLCRILTDGHLNSPRGYPTVKLSTLAKHCRDIIILSGCRMGKIPSLILRGRFREALNTAAEYLHLFGRSNFFLELQPPLLPGSQALNNYLAQLAEQLKMDIVATNNVHYCTKEGFPVHDLLTCVRTLTKLEDVHPERRLNAENDLKSPAEMANLFYQYPRAVHNTLMIADQCAPALELGEKIFPSFQVPSGEPAAAYLRRLTYEGARKRYGRLTRAITERLEHELDIICRLGYEDYFLLVWDLVDYAKKQKIRYAGRGSAADSAVAYCLFITEVDSINRGLLFERFMSLERAQKPDIDIDFDSRYRDRVADYLYKKYGSNRVAGVCTYNTFRARSAFRDLGKAMDFPAEEIDLIAKRLPFIRADQIDLALEKFPELREGGLPLEKYRQLFGYCAAVSGFPRFISTHLGGIVVSRDPLVNLTPLQKAAKGIVVSQFDKEYIEDLGLVKLDLLSLRTMSVVENATLTIRAENPEFDYETIPLNDKATYELLNTGQTIGVFQLESPAQRALQSRLQASCLEDIVASVALIRPGPIKGNMVEPFIARRHGKEPVSYLHPKLKPILEKTYGVVLFQEQVIEIATVIAGFTPGEADRLRRVMTHARSHEDMLGIGREFVAKAIANGISKEIAETIFGYIVGYASYGFCEAHAAAFATTAYKTAYLVKHYPAEYYAAILSHQPMGFYGSNTICVEARRRGINILPPDINLSQRDFTVEKGNIRISLSQVKGMKASVLDNILAERNIAPFSGIDDFLNRVKIDRALLTHLILCGAFDSLHSNRKQLLWWVNQQRTFKLQKEERVCQNGSLPVNLPWPEIADYSEVEKFNWEYKILGIDVRRHYMSYWRAYLDKHGFTNSLKIKSLPHGAKVKVAGLPIRPHRPPTRSGKVAVFLSLEDEFGLVDVTLFEKTYQKFGNIIFSRPTPPLQIYGTLQRRGNGVSVIAHQVRTL